MSEYTVYDLITSLRKKKRKILIAIPFFLGFWWYFLLPTNVGIIMIAIFFILILGSMSFSFLHDQSDRRRVKGLLIVIGFLLPITMFGSMVFKNYDRAQYFDDQLIYADGLPFYQPVHGDSLRVVDFILAQKIMDKSNVFGSNQAIKDIHLGNIGGKTFWIGAASYDSIILNDDHNTINGFVAVDFTDPTKPAKIVEQKFSVGQSLILNHDLQRTVHSININYIAGDNAYYSFNDVTEKMEMVVPYHVRDNAYFGEDRGGFVTTDMFLDGGVLILDENGDLIKDYKDRSEIPAHARIQLYSETWLEMMIQTWGQRIVDDNDISWAAGALPWARSARRMGIDDDVRVVVDPDTGEYVQYVLLDSTDSTNQILRGAIKANSSGLFYYNWEDFNFIDTNSAQDHVQQAVVNVIGTSTHGYTTLLPILYPIKENVTSMNDYAYVVSLQLGESRFGGISITDPSDKTGTLTVVEFAPSEGAVNVPETLDKAIARYLEIKGGAEANQSELAGTFDINSKFSYVSDGFTNYVMEGFFSNLNQNITVIFNEELLQDTSEWIIAVTSEVGDTIQVTITLIDSVYFAIQIQ